MNKLTSFASAVAVAGVLLAVPRTAFSDMAVAPAAPEEPNNAAAENEVTSDEPSWHLDASLGSTLPVDIAPRVTVETPIRLRLSMSLGLLPGPYVDLINEVAQSIGAYNDATAALLTTAIDGSLIWRTTVGFRFVESLGFYGSAGYVLATLGGSTSAIEILEEASGQELPAEVDAAAPIELSSTLHLIELEVGYEHHFDFGLFLRGGIGYTGVLGSSTSIEPGFQPAAPQLVNAAATAGEEYLDDIFTSYVHTPEVNLGVGYRFF